MDACRRRAHRPRHSYPHDSRQIEIMKYLLLILLTITAKAKASDPDWTLKAATTAQPQQQDVLRAMRLANTYFMEKWPAPGTQIATNTARPSHIWTRAVYYEGLM